MFTLGSKHNVSLSCSRSSRPSRMLEACCKFFFFFWMGGVHFPSEISDILSVWNSTHTSQKFKSFASSLARMDFSTGQVNVWSMSCHPVSLSFFLSNFPPPCKLFKSPHQPKQDFKTRLFFSKAFYNAIEKIMWYQSISSRLHWINMKICFSCLISDGILPSVISEKQTADITGCCYGHSSDLKSRLIKSICGMMSEELNGIRWLANPVAKNCYLSGRDVILQKSFKSLSWWSSGKLRGAATWMRTETPWPKITLFTLFNFITNGSF